MAIERITLTEVSDQTNGDGSSKKLYLQTVLKNEGQEGFKLLLLEGNTIWEGEVTEHDLERLSEKSKLDYNTYVSETKAAFTSSKTTESSFECHLENSTGDTSILTWKKVSARDVKYNLGSVTLTKSKNSAFNLSKVLSYCISQTGLLQEEIHKLQASNERLSQERLTALQKLEKCVDAKDEMEQDLFSKFVTVLNSKKEKIRQLKNLNNEPSTEDCSMSGTTKDRGASSKQIYEDRDEWNRSTSEDSSTDTEESPVKKQRTRPKIVELESSLNLEEDGDKQLEAPVARRPRRNAANKKASTPKPVLPRVSSGGSADRPHSTRSGLRKSNSSQKSSDNLDPDKLLDDF